jgi:hypothetical protein
MHYKSCVLVSIAALCVAQAVFASESSVVETATLVPADGQVGEFGSSVAINGQTIIAGSPFVASNAGAAYVYVLNGSNWSQQAELTALDSAAFLTFGFSVSIDGDTALIGAPLNLQSPGAAYVFTRSGTTWSQQAKLIPADGVNGDSFGYSVALSGDTAVIGAYQNNNDTGAVYVFTRSGTVWSLQEKLTASDAAATDQFGRAVGLSGDTAVIGAWFKNQNAGAAYIFMRSGATWSQQAEISDPGAAANDEFGWAVAVDSDTALIGSPGVKQGNGAAYVFTRSGTTWSQQAALDTVPSRGFNFGFSVAQSGDVAWIGTPLKQNGAGGAFAFARSGTNWSSAGSLPGVRHGQLGYAVAISGGLVVAGVPFQTEAIVGQVTP